MRCCLQDVLSTLRVRNRPARVRLTVLGTSGGKLLADKRDDTFLSPSPSENFWGEPLQYGNLCIALHLRILYLRTYVAFLMMPARDDRKPSSSSACETAPHALLLLLARYSCLKCARSAARKARHRHYDNVDLTLGQSSPAKSLQRAVRALSLHPMGSRLIRIERLPTGRRLPFRIACQLARYTVPGGNVRFRKIRLFRFQSLCLLSVPAVHCGSLTDISGNRPYGKYWRLAIIRTLPLDHV